MLHAKLIKKRHRGYCMHEKKWVYGYPFGTEVIIGNDIDKPYIPANNINIKGEAHKHQCNTLHFTNIDPSQKAGFYAAHWYTVDEESIHQVTDYTDCENNPIYEKDWIQNDYARKNQILYQVWFDAEENQWMFQPANIDKTPFEKGDAQLSIDWLKLTADQSLIQIIGNPYTKRLKDSIR